MYYTVPPSSERLPIAISRKRLGEQERGTPIFEARIVIYDQIWVKNSVFKTFFNRNSVQVSLVIASMSGSVQLLPLKHLPYSYK